MSNNLNKNRIWLVGAGAMAVEYSKVLIDLNVNFSVIGRSKTSAQKFKEKTGIKVFIGGLAEFLKNTQNIIETAIVAVNVEFLPDITKQLIHHGTKKILLEKPGALSFDELDELSSEAKKYNVNIFIAYNRRFYASILKILDIIHEDGGIKSCIFEFTEWSHIIEKLEKPHFVKEAWFIGNSTHVIDLAFFLIGDVKSLATFTSSGLNWHPKGSIFTGAGESQSGALFSYHANWESPGRWGLEIMTKNNRLILRPLEKLSVQKIGSVQIEEIEIDDKLDQNYKPGVYLQTKTFLEDESSKFLLSIHEHKQNMSNIYLKILEG